MSDTTTKLFAIPVRCYSLDQLSPVVGAWGTPYFETTVGLGFSGSCFEALTVIAHITQSLSALVAPDGDEPIPTRDGLTNLIAKLCEGYFSQHSGDGDPLLLLLVFGFDGPKPWIGRITWDKSQGLRSTVMWATDDTLETVGQDALFQQRADDLRKRIQKHRDRLFHKPVSSIPDATFDRALELARYELAERKSTEEEMLDQIESEFFAGIGGVLQRLELAVEGERVVAGFTQDDRSYLDGAYYSVAPGASLGPIAIVEKMGRKVRRPKAEPKPDNAT
ncbi:hypothetical protein ASD50_03735 [Mesorhizobium sp. Root552]|nr:hypothetical protein ASD50_03735 [Mesorhizobium sp. Root552]